MQNDPRSHGLWEMTAPPPPATTALAGEIDVDVVVVGGGFTGLSAALHLAEAGTRVAVLEAVEIGFGGSGRNAGLVNAGMWVMPDDLASVLGPVHGERALTLLGEAPKLVYALVEKHGIDCELVKNGTLHLAVGRKGLAEIAARGAQWRKRGAPVRVLDAAETALKVGSTRYPGALLDQRAGTIQPLAYVRGLARAAIGAGARIFTGSPVRSFARDGARWAVTTPGGRVRADWIVVATNAYTVDAAGVPWREVRTELVPLPYFQFATEPLPADAQASILPERQGAWDTKQVLSSFRLDRAGRLVFGSVGALRHGGAAVHRAWALRAIRRIFPQLGPVKFQAGWFGRIGMTDDSVPRFHAPAPNVVGFSGYNGRGIAPGTVFGRVLARHILGQENEMPLPTTPVVAAKHRRSRGAYYEAGAQVAHIVEARG